MAPYRSRIDTTSEEFAEQRRSMLGLIDGIESLHRRIDARTEAQRPRFEKRGQLLPSERLDMLFDRGTESLQLSQLAGYGMHDDDGEEDVLGGAVLVRIGLVCGRRVVAIANNSAIKGGATMPMGLKKYLRAQEIALANRLPVLMLVESAGANLAYQSELFVEGGRRFYNIARLSAAGIPQIAVVHGSSTAGGAYIPGMADYTIMVRGRAKVFLAGPPLLKAATGEIAEDEELGGAEMHATVAGTAEFIAEDDADAIAIARDIVSRFDTPPAEPQRRWEEPIHLPEELAGAIPTDYRQPYDIRELVCRLVDGSDFLDFKPDYGRNMLCCVGQVEGRSCGFIGNNGPIEANDAAKTAQFIQICSQARHPIVFLQNTTGYMVGRNAEQSGIIKHGAKMIQAVSNAPVPRITFLVGGSFGAGNFGLCGRSYGPDFLFAWPNTRIAVMGAEQAATVMEIVTEQKLARSGKAVDRERMAAMRKEIVDRFERESTALYATARVWDDGIIDPRDTRRILSLCLSICAERERRHPQPLSFGVSRF